MSAIDSHTARLMESTLASLAFAAPEVRMHLLAEKLVRPLLAQKGAAPTVEELRAALERAQEGTAESSVESAVAVYLAAAGARDAFAEVQEVAKALVAAVMEETGRTAYRTPAGAATVTAPATVVSYDAKALDALLVSSDQARRMLEPHRRETQRPGTLRIAAPRGGKE